MTVAKRYGRRPRAVMSVGHEVPLDGIMIDRELRWMLERDGYDLHGIAEGLITQGYGYEPKGSDVKIALQEVGDNVFELVREGLARPVMSTATLIGTACYSGDCLFVWQLLPQTLCAGVVGRRLGDVVATGISRLDGRLILKANACTENYWPPTAATRFKISPDLIELGSRPV